ncbi:1,4-dihydroxy-2-naphthoate octaprenyltransferase [Oscillospiraceae bacterium WX1]
MQSSLSSWMRAIRPPTLTASVIPVVLGSVLAAKVYPLHVIGFLLAVIAMTFFQIASNLINDVDDFNRHVDTQESLGSSRVIVEELLTQKQVRMASRIFFLLAVGIGVYLSIVGGVVILIIGLFGAAGAYAYTGKPFRLKYRGYGIPLVFFMFGPLPVVGAYYLSAGSFSWLPLIQSVPVGLLTTAILHANDLRDIEHDRKAGIKSLAMAMGTQKARLFYRGLILGAYAAVIIDVLSGVLSAWGLLVIVSVPLALMLMKSAETTENLRTLDQKTAALQLTFGLLLLIAVLF